MFYTPNYHQMAAGYPYAQPPASSYQAAAYNTSAANNNNSRYSSPYPTSEYYPPYKTGYQSPYPNAPDPYYSYYYNNYYMNQQQQAYHSMIPQAPTPVPHQQKQQQHIHGYATPTNDLNYNNRNFNSERTPYENTSPDKSHHTKSKKDRKKKKAPTFWLTKEFPDINGPSNSIDNEANYKNYIYNSNYGYPYYDLSDVYKNAATERYDGVNIVQHHVESRHDEHAAVNGHVESKKVSSDSNEVFIRFTFLANA
jgi:hypothetical protein